MSEDRPYDITIDYRDSQSGETKTFKMRKAKWLNDQQLQVKLVDPQGRPNLKELWISRIQDTVEGITREIINGLDNFTMNIYIIKWLEYNDVNEGSFLLAEKKSETQS